MGLGVWDKKKEMEVTTKDDGGEKIQEAEKTARKEDDASVSVDEGPSEASIIELRPQGSQGYQPEDVETRSINPGNLPPLHPPSLKHTLADSINYKLTLSHLLFSHLRLFYDLLTPSKQVVWVSSSSRWRC